MKMNKVVRKAGEEHYSSEKVKGRLHAPDKKKEKNTKRSIFNEIEDDGEVDYRSLLRKEDSILYYYDDDGKEEEVDFDVKDEDEDFDEDEEEDFEDEEEDVYNDDDERIRIE